MVLDVYIYIVEKRKKYINESLYLMKAYWKR